MKFYTETDIYYSLLEEIYLHNLAFLHYMQSQYSDNHLYAILH